MALLELGLPNKAHFKGHAGPAAVVSIDKRNCQSTLKKDFQQGHGISSEWCGHLCDPLTLPALLSNTQRAGPSKSVLPYSESKQTAAVA